MPLAIGAVPSNEVPVAIKDKLPPLVLLCFLRSQGGVWKRRILDVSVRHLWRAPFSERTRHFGGDFTRSVAQICASAKA